MNHPFLTQCDRFIRSQIQEFLLKMVGFLLTCFGIINTVYIMVYKQMLNCSQVEHSAI